MSPDGRNASNSKQSLVRVNPEDKEILKHLSSAEGESMAAIIHKALKAYKRQRFFADLNLAYERLRSGQEPWDNERQERSFWDVIDDQPSIVAEPDEE
jgi:predicted DNA-binding protein